MQQVSRRHFACINLNLSSSKNISVVLSDCSKENTLNLNHLHRTINLETFKSNHADLDDHIFRNDDIPLLFRKQ